MRAFQYLSIFPNPDRPLNIGISGNRGIFINEDGTANPSVGIDSSRWCNNRFCECISHFGKCHKRDIFGMPGQIHIEPGPGQINRNKRASLAVKQWDNIANFLALRRKNAILGSRYKIGGIAQIGQNFIFENIETRQCLSRSASGLIGIGR